MEVGTFRMRKETSKETIRRLLKLTDGKDYGIFAPPMDAQVALNELAHHLLGEDWYSVNPVSQEQINTEIVYEIERKYVKKVPSCKH
jgi:hypothetical protein